jgi:hypothetical protein
MNLDSLILDERNIVQQFQKYSFIFINGHAAQLQFKELFHLSVVVSFIQVFILEIPLEFFPSDIFLSNVLHLHKWIPPHGWMFFLSVDTSQFFLLHERNNSVVGNISSCQATMSQHFSLSYVLYQT